MISSQTPVARIDRRRWPFPSVLLAGGAAIAWLAFTIGARPLALPEEGRYVGVAWEMLRSGHWLVPTENGLPFFHKPPLFYWLAAASMQLFGAAPAAARLASLLGAVLGGVGLYVVTRRRAGTALAGATMLVLATEPFFFGGAQFANLDMLVAGCVALSIVFAADAALAAQHGEPHRRALVAAWVAAALGVMAKGLIGIVLPGLVVLVWLVVTRRARNVVTILSPLGIGAFLLVTAPWFIAVQAEYPGFARYFFVYQHFERFIATGFNNVQPWWFFFVLVPALTLPWSSWLLRSAWRARTGEAPDVTALRQLMWTWLAVVLVFFSLPQSKPSGYAMPVLFPVAWLAADAWQALRARSPAIARRWQRGSIVVAVLLCLGAVFVGSARFGFARDNSALAETLRTLRAPGDPVVFVGEYFFDVPMLARLGEPVPVTSDWAVPPTRDNWKRELAEAAPFAPALAATLLVDAAHGFVLRCGARPLWLVARHDDEATVAAVPGAVRVETGKRASLWRVAPADCAAPSGALR